MKQIETLPIPSEQLTIINNHLDVANKHIYIDQGQSEAITWLQKSMESINPQYIDAINTVIELNPLSSDVSYTETGYDSCQSHRKLAKVVSELFLIGGMTYESNLLGLQNSFTDVQKEIKSELKVPQQIQSTICDMAKELGGNQDFIFPGVTKTDESTESLEDMTWLTLTGKPIVSVRNITGIGGIRSDKEWNFSTDLPSYIELKIKEDKRYYPGMGIFYWLSKYSLDDILAIGNINNPNIIQKITKLQKAILQTPKVKIEGLSVLCSTYIPTWNETKKWLEYKNDDKQLELASAFHSPSYEFDFLNKLFSNQNLSENQNKTILLQFDNLISKLCNSWSFNSTIHIPWTSELDILSNNLMGKITNLNGDYCLRYGIGYQGKSLEIKEFHTGQERLYPADTSGKTCYAIIYYPYSNVFQGDNIQVGFNSKDMAWQNLKQDGLINTMLKIIKSYEK